MKQGRFSITFPQRLISSLHLRGELTYHDFSISCPAAQIVFADFNAVVLRVFVAAFTWHG